MNRRGFLGAMLAAASAPAIVKAENMMRIITPRPRGQLNCIYTLDEFAFLEMPDPVEDGIILSENFLKKLNNNGVSGTRMPTSNSNRYSTAKRWFIERPPGLQALPSAEVKKIHQEWLNGLRRV